MELAFCKALRKICNFVFIQRQVSFHLSPNSQFSRWKIIKSRNKKMRFLLLLPLITIQSSSLLCKHLSFARCSKHIFARLPSCFWNLKLRLSKLSLYIRWACAQNSLWFIAHKRQGSNLYLLESVLYMGSIACFVWLCFQSCFCALVSLFEI